MYFAGRYLKHNKSTRTPSNLVFFDTETRERPIPDHPKRTLQTFKLGFARSLRLEQGKPRAIKETLFYRVDYFWDWLYGRSDKRRPTWCFAHNVGFDLRVLGFFDQLEKGRLELYGQESESQASDGRNPSSRFAGLYIDRDLPTIVKVRWRSNKAILWLLDSGNYFRTKLEEVAKAEGIDYVPLPTDQADLPAWERRCRNDVDIVQAAMLSYFRFVRENDLGVFKTTIAGQSYAAFRHRFMDHGILPHNDTESRKLEREAYHGGEVRVFFCGSVMSDLQQVPLEPIAPVTSPKPLLAGPIHHLDVNSLYPAVMRDHDYPVQLCDVRTDMRSADLAVSTPGVDRIARVSIDCRESDYPLKYRNQLYHAAGRFITTLAGPELLRAVLAGHVVGVGRVQIYVTKPLFRRFVDTVYDLRLRYRAKGNLPFEHLCKLLLNSLHGKFGQWGHQLIPCPGMQSPFPYGTWHERTIEHVRLHEGGQSAVMGDGKELVISRRVSREMRAIAWQSFQVIEEIERDEAFPAISAFVTARGREYMRDLRTIAGARNAIYQDTDSLHCLPEGYRSLQEAGRVDADRLGSLKLCDTADSAEYRGIKSYTFGTERVEAGLKLSAEQLPNGVFRERQFQGLREATASVPAPGVIVTTVDKLPAQHDIRGMVGPDGWVRPICKTWEGTSDE